MIPPIGTEVEIFLILAIIVAIFTKRTKIPYTIGLVFAGLFVAFTGIELLPLSKEIIFFLFLPPLLFEGAVHLNLPDLGENYKTISLLAIFGVLFSMFLIGFGVHYLLGLPLLFGLLFGAIVSPTDPVSVLALFKKLGISKKLSTIVEGESLFNDGTGIVVFEIILGLIMLNYFSIAESIFEFLLVVSGGFAIGGIAGIVVYLFMKNIDDHLIEVMTTIVLAYGAFMLAESFHVSGVIAVVVAGLLIGNYGKRFAMSPTTRFSIISFWEIVVFLVNSILFIMIGATIPISGLIQNLDFILVAILFVLIARAINVYSITTLTNFLNEKTPRNWQHIINWGGLRGSIPIALVLGIQTLDIAFKDQITWMTFGVVFFSLVFQGLTMTPLIKKLKIITVDEVERSAESVLARTAAIKRALKELDNIHDEGEISDVVYDRIKFEYEKKLESLKRSYGNFIDRREGIKVKQENYARKKALLAEKSAINDHMGRGLISEEVGKEIIEEINSLLEELE
ncbi:MAG: Na+/H+ antiporter [Candidatus Methylarchaceae archaeon HK02M1]|nr:Na+/H+ antiporter [Candidatus Methylarchaceae archaeon HK01M]MCP8312352.1 Na+/H+ antiporter [Candidatus Methylarchaceae archaeon HK02M1]